MDRSLILTQVQSAQPLEVIERKLLEAAGRHEFSLIASHDLRDTLTGAGPGVAAPRHPLDARPGWGPGAQPGRCRASLFAGGANEPLARSPTREFRGLPRRLGPRCQRRGPRVMKKKGVELATECRVYEVCNALQAKQVLEADRAPAAMLPCRIVLYGANGNYTLATMRPSALVQMMEAPGIAALAQGVEDTLLAIMREAAEAEVNEQRRA